MRAYARTLLCIAVAAGIVSPAYAVDSDGDGVDDSVDVCCNTPAGVVVDSQGRPLGDFDHDCDVDQSDFGVFQANMTAAMSCTPEVCDGIDNDCNCIVDDVNPLTCGVGACYRQAAGCVNGVPQTCVPGNPTQEICSDGIDNDCDGLADCADTGSCPNGSACASGNRACQAGACGCATGYADCDGMPANGCEYNLNSNPTCGTFTALANVSGDTGSQTATQTANQERWFRVYVTEDNGQCLYLSATVTLTPPAGADYDLYVYCSACGGTPLSSTVRGSGVETVVTARSDACFGEDSSYYLIIEVRYFAGSACGNYTLQVTGNTSASQFTCGS